MITFRGDKFVQGKRFIENDKSLTFVKKTSKGFIFLKEGVQVLIPKGQALRLKECGDTDGERTNKKN